MIGRGVNMGERIAVGELERSESGIEASYREPTGGPVRMMMAPDPEVSSASGRRRFSGTYKARIVRKADACTKSGEIGALLRREGVYSSYLTKWRKVYLEGAEAALADDKRGRKATKNPLGSEVEKLRRELERTEKKLKQAEMIIDFQRNLCEILGISPARVSTEGER